MTPKSVETRACKEFFNRIGHELPQGMTRLNVRTRRGGAARWRRGNGNYRPVPALRVLEKRTFADLGAKGTEEHGQFTHGDHLRQGRTSARSHSPLAQAARLAPPLRARLRYNRTHGRFVDVKLKYVGTTIVAGHVKVELSAPNIVEVEGCGQDGFLLEVGPCKHFAQR